MDSKRAPDSYLLSRDHVDCDRLNLQHSLWTQMFGYLLHPLIDTSNPHLKVADLGTGTALTPPRAFLPSNVRLHEWDIFSEVPEHLVGQYDVVHVRLLVFVVRGEPTELLRRFLTLLMTNFQIDSIGLTLDRIYARAEPGGWLQWGEPDVPSMRLVKADPSLAENGLRELFELTAAQDPRLIPQWPDQLGAYFAREGLTAVETHRVQAAATAPHLEFAMHQCNLLMYEMIAARAADGSRAQQIRALIPRAVGESKRGAMYAMHRVVVVGQKKQP
ncbi:UMTA methyltransferase family protein [Aspergillus violaceofuscus CBS 115571]|uniref:UMTA methyltransferase family protein n=1 Tax=Aspergillus violaceofuscus (strain CBS 115571) TaxID=1450538 RepID=A0A2V5GST1_ASPV1|nr:UMTA methyltransferase family protein [Aspergillus violaceofuscus CBS 115571]